MKPFVPFVLAVGLLLLPGLAALAQQDTPQPPPVAAPQVPGATPAPLPPGVDLSTPEKTLASLFDALKRGDATAAAATIQDAKPSPEITPEGARQSPAFTLKDTDTFTRGEDVALVIFTLEFLSGNETVTQRDFAEMRKVNDEWKIQAGSLPAKPSAGIGSIIRVFPLMLTALRYGREAFTNPAQSSNLASGAARDTVTLSNMKQLCLGALMYTQDYDEVYPLAKNWRDGLYPYLKNRDVYGSALDKKGGQSFKFNPALAGKTVAVIAAPADTVLFYEGAVKNPTFRYDDNTKAIIGFADGHAKLVTRAEAEKLRWNP